MPGGGAFSSSLPPRGEPGVLYVLTAAARGQRGRPPSWGPESSRCLPPSPGKPGVSDGADACLRCQAENKQEDCVVVWGECNHSFHNCCMSLWVKQNNRCPLCQQDWVVQRIGK
ncbi:RING-box protein 2 isoform X2 [Gopherus evgoodei]|uniref:RING-box protein 2 isoform X2 n=1 Tax=Gopherus evgoodei TaxID=1825980 RepID=UPI0011CF9E74|nr:RING-box protein 2 isoform X2 [Gopherus evgoodei]